MISTSIKTIRVINLITAVNTKSYDLPFVILLNIHFWKYYITLRAYVREPPFNHFNLTSSDQLSLVLLLAISIYRFLWAGQQNKWKGMQSVWARCSTLPNRPIDIAPHPISHLSPAKVSSNPHHTILHRRAPLEECFYFILEIFYLLTHLVIHLLLP